MPSNRSKLTYAVAFIILVVFGTTIWIGLVRPLLEYREACQPIHALGGNVYPAAEMASLSGRAGVGAVEFWSASSQVSDEELALLLPHLESLPSLSRVRLNDQPISDLSVEDLKRLTQVEILELPGTKLTRKGIEQLRRDLPKCEIVSDFEIRKH